MFTILGGGTKRRLRGTVSFSNDFVEHPGAGTGPLNHLLRYLAMRLKVQLNCDRESFSIVRARTRYLASSNASTIRQYLDLVCFTIGRNLSGVPINESMVDNSGNLIITGEGHLR